MLNPCAQCNIDPAHPERPCLTCQKVSRKSKKVIHHIGCHRYKLQEITLFRACGLGYTDRWDGAQVMDVPGTGAELTINIDQGLSDQPLSFKVHRFVPRRGDTLKRSYTGLDGERGEIAMTPYALADAHATKLEYIEYINKHAVETMKKVVLGEDEIARVVYGTIYTHASLHQSL